MRSQILGSIIACLYFMFGVESRSQQFLYLTAMTYGINDVHFIFSALLSEADSTFLPSSIYFVVYQLTASFCYIINAIVIMQTYNSPGDCIFGGWLQPSALLRHLLNMVDATVDGAERLCLETAQSCSAAPAPLRG
ncbi:uncharacterized protein LOC119177414 [Rhipicephalus microplus]|uniref:uncharacterized protein LOC119177414 n=1 Tax=Rhipicephalus microplus TaxID=6941 RepID=UPI003F6CB6A8